MVDQLLEGSAASVRSGQIDSKLLSHWVEHSRGISSVDYADKSRSET
jgi:hypothetical protein